MDKEEKLKKDILLLENYIEDLFSFTPLPLCYINPSGIILEINPAFKEVLGSKQEDIIGESILSFIDEKEMEELLEEVKKEDSTQKKEVIIENKEGESISAVAFAKSRKVGEEINGVFLSFFDITEIKDANKKLEEKIEEMEKINRLTVGREIEMVKLKEKNRRLKKAIRKYRDKKDS